MSQLLITERLIIRSFVAEDTENIHRILDLTFGDGSGVKNSAALEDRRSWIEWSALNQQWFPKLHQPPYGDLAVMLKSSGVLIGSVGLVPLLAPFDQIPELGAKPSGWSTPEVGLFWVIDPHYQGTGYATEAAQALIDFAFSEMKLKRILAMTADENAASQAVMKKLGMQLTRNPLPEPSWLQVVGVLANNSR